MSELTDLHIPNNATEPEHIASSPVVTNDEADSTDASVAESEPADAPPACDEPQQPNDNDEAQGGLKRSDQLFVGTLIIIALTLMIAHWVRLSHWGTEPVEIDRHESRWYDYRVDVNEATWVEWVQLEGIGETLSRRIIADREENGPYETIDDLDRVKGIGPKTIEKLRPWLRIGPPELKPSENLDEQN